MSSYGSPSLGAAQRATSLREVQFPGVTERLVSPGVVPLPAVSKEAQILDQVLGVVSQAGATARTAAGYVGQLNDEQRIAAQKEAADAERAAKRQEQYDQGQAALHAVPVVSRLGADFRDPAKPIPQDLLAYAQQVTDQETQGASEAYKAQYLRSVVTGLSQEYEARRTADARATQQDIFTKLSAQAFTNPQGVAGVKQTLDESFGNLPEGVRYRPLYVAAERLAETGSESFKEIAAQLPSSFDLEKSELAAKYAEASTRKQTALRQVAEDDVGSSLYADNYAEALAKVDTYKDKFGGEWASQKRNAILEKQRSNLKTSLAAVNQARKDSVIANRMGEVRGMILAGRSSDVGDMEVEYDDENGERQKINVEGTKAVKDGFDVEFARLDGIAPENYRPENYVPSFSAPVIDLATKNGYLVPQWKNRFAAVENQMSVAASTMRDGTPDKASAGPMMIQGYKDYQKIASVNPTYARNIAGEKTAAVFESAMMLQRFPQIGNDTVVSDQQALLSAIQGVRVQDTLDTTTLKKSIATLHGTAFWRMLPGTANEPENAMEIYNTLAPFASYLSKGMAPDTAAETAFKMFEGQFVEINGHYQIAQPDLPPLLKEDLPKIAKFAMDEYVAKYGAKYGVTADELTMRPVPNTRLWQLWFKGGTAQHPAPTAVPAENTDDTTFGYRDLWKALNKINQRIKREIQIENEVSQRAKQLGITNKQETAGQGLR